MHTQLCPQLLPQCTYMYAVRMLCMLYRYYVCCTDVMLSKLEPLTSSKLLRPCNPGRQVAFTKQLLS